MRRDFLRVVGGIHMRILYKYNEDPLMLFLMQIECCSDPPTEYDLLQLDCARDRFKSNADMHIDCRLPVEHRRFASVVPDCRVGKLIKRGFVTGIMANERDHSGSQKRATAKQTRPRAWRRQVAASVVLRSKALYCKISRAHRRKWKCCPR